MSLPNLSDSRCDRLGKRQGGCLFGVVVFSFSGRTFVFFVLSLDSSVPHREFGWEESLQNDLFSVKWDVKT